MAPLLPIPKGTGINYKLAYNITLLIYSTLY